MATRSIRQARSASAAQRLPVRGETEAQFQAAVVTLARHCGWLAYHPFSSQHSEPGYPDLTLVKGNRLLMVELKTARGHLRPAQRIWLGALSQCPGVEVAVWRPAQWDAIVAALVHGQRLDAPSAPVEVVP